MGRAVVAGYRASRSGSNRQLRVKPPIQRNGHSLYGRVGQAYGQAAAGLAVPLGKVCNKLLKAL